MQHGSGRGRQDSTVQFDDDTDTSGCSIVPQGPGTSLSCCVEFWASLCSSKVPGTIARFFVGGNDPYSQSKGFEIRTKIKAGSFHTRIIRTRSFWPKQWEWFRSLLKGP